jgi:hypothetical protein
MNHWVPHQHFHGRTEINHQRGKEISELWTCIRTRDLLHRDLRFVKNFQSVKWPASGGIYFTVWTFALLLVAHKIPRFYGTRICTTQRRAVLSYPEPAVSGSRQPPPPLFFLRASGSFRTVFKCVTYIFC